ncbi:MAG TPA: DNA-directed RNA polymerase subunit omega [Thermoanaerobaculia bacterium]|nr:DNA-directed RNA polymerase subunit omega [Thermoanaerobaculia bacterium]
MDRISENFDSKFRFVLLSARRAEQLMRGAEPRILVKSPKVARTAMQELLEDRVEWGYGPPPDAEADPTDLGEDDDAEAAADGAN